MDGQDTLRIHPRVTGTSILRPILCIACGRNVEGPQPLSPLGERSGLPLGVESHNEC